MKRFLRACWPIVCVLVCVATHAEQKEQLKAGEFSPPRQAPDFVLRGTNGNDLKLTQYQGKVVLLGFGYTSCPNVCPVTLAVLAQAHRQLGTQASQVQVIYLTVDPERDTVAHLKEYLTTFDSSFIGGSGSDAQMAAVRKQYGVTAERHGSGNDYVISHSSFVYLVDRNGKLRALMPFGSRAEDYVHDLALLLKE